MNRRSFLASSAYVGTFSRTLGAAPGPEKTPYTPPDYQKPVFELHKFFPHPVKIESIELLQTGNKYFVRTRSTDGAVGMSQTKNMEYYVPMLLGAVAPYFIGKDARELENLVDGVYAQGMNYKMAGQAFWAPVAYVEQSLFDMLGRIANKPA